MVFLLVFSLFVAAVQAEEESDEDSTEADDTEETTDTEDVELEDSEDTTETNNDDALTEEEVTELDLTDVDAEVTAMQEAHDETKYTRTYYFMTEKILTAEAVIAFLNENFPGVDTTAIAEYKAELEEIRDSLTIGSDFEAVHDEVVELVKNAREETKEIMEENDVEASAVVEAVAEYKKEATEDDEAKESWGEARSGYAHAKATVVLARLNNFEKVANYYSDSENVDELNTIIGQLEAIGEEIAAAAGNFDKEEVDALVEEAKDLIQQAKELAKNIGEEVRDAHKTAREEAREAMKSAREDTKETMNAAREDAKEARDQTGQVLKAAREEARDAMKTVREEAKAAREEAKDVRGKHTLEQESEESDTIEDIEDEVEGSEDAAEESEEEDAEDDPDNGDSDEDAEEIQ